MTALALYDAVASGLSALALVYLLYSGRFAVAYAAFFRALAAGLLAYSAVAVVLAFLPGSFAADALVGLFVLPALYLLVRDQLLTDSDGVRLRSAFDADPGESVDPPD